jgi:hypothetical protein
MFQSNSNPNLSVVNQRRPSITSTLQSGQSGPGSSPPLTPTPHDQLQSHFHSTPPRRTFSRSSTDPSLHERASPRRSLSIRNHFVNLANPSQPHRPRKLRRASEFQMSHANGSFAPPAQINGQSVNTQMLETASKRIQTLDYLRKSYIATPLICFS